ncbi:MAG: HTH-type transcriptional regulator BhcR [Rhizobiaceae bacterium]
MTHMESENRRRGRPRAFHDKTETNTVRSLDKALNVLRLLATGRGLSLTEIAETSNISAPTVYRALITFQQHGMVSFDEAGQLWSIGVETFRIGSAFLVRTNVVEQARPVMQALMQKSGETANLGVLDGNDVVFVSQVETHEPIRAFFRPGSSGALHASGIGKALFAHMSDREATRVARQVRFEPYTARTIGTAEELLLDRIKAREVGFAIDDEERTEGMRCIAAPIFNAFGEAIAAISISGPTVRMRRERNTELGALVQRAAKDITGATGGIHGEMLSNNQTGNRGS